MKITLAALAAVILPNAALAQHYICTRVFEPGLIGSVFYVTILDPWMNVMVKEKKSFGPVDHYTIKFSGGRFDTGRYSNEWSAIYQGIDWGSKPFQETWDNGGGSTYKIGCYGVYGSDYCGAENKKKLRQHCLDVMG